MKTFLIVHAVIASKSTPVVVIDGDGIEHDGEHVVGKGTRVRLDPTAPYVKRWREMKCLVKV